MRVLLITSSARGHAIAEALARSPQEPEIFSLCTTRNPGIRRIAAAQEVIDIMDFPVVCAHAKRWQPDFAIIGPDDPIGAGLADILEEIGIPAVAPTKSFAQIESSKGFARELLRKYEIEASPKFRIFSSHPLSLTLSPRERGMLYHPLPLGGRVRERGFKKEMYRFIHDDLQGNYVVKYDGLRGGKGVKVSGEHLSSIKDGVDYASRCLAECGRVVIEEKLEGVEFSLMSFVSGTSVVHMPAVQDHKRAYEGDLGPNTGGMGSYSMPDHSLPFLTQADLERAKEINQMVAEALRRECGASHDNPLPLPLSPSEPARPAGRSGGRMFIRAGHCGRGGGYRGILYGGYMVTRSTSPLSTSSEPTAVDGIRVIEFNARFGDPEALNVLPLLESDFVTICQAILSGELTEDLVRFAPKATVCKYIVPEGYPENKNQKGVAIQLPTACHGEKVFFGDLTEDSDGTLRLGTSRALGVVGIGDTIEEAERTAQTFCEQVQGPVRFRSDIGTAALLQQRVAMMQQLRSLAVGAQKVIAH